jgi:hypothetical protein
MIPPLHYIVIPAVIAFLSASVAALLVIFLTPRLQHYFWKRQKREEIRLGIVTEVNRLAAEFIMNCFGRHVPELVPALDATFYQSWQVAAGQVKVLFSHSTYQAFDTMWIKIISELLFSAQEVRDRIPRVINFTQARDTALQAFYKEIAILQGETRWSRFKQRFKR